jgi:WD40 repeat protein
VVLLGASALLVRPADAQSACATAARWGDVNGDSTVNILDAQQIARFSVGLSVASSTAMAARGDVTANGAVDILDAQQIARFSVALSASTRINTTIATALAVTPVSTSVTMGNTVPMAVVARNAANVDVTSCVTVTYASAPTTVATVSSSGVVTGVAAGTATITVAGGGATATATVIVTTGGGGAADLFTVRDSVTLSTQGFFVGAASRDFSRIVVAPYVDATATTRDLVFLDASGTIEARRNIGGTSWAVAMTPDGTRTVAGSDDENLYFFQGTTLAASGRPITGNTQVRGVAISDDGRWVGAGGAKFTLHDWNSATPAVPVYVDSATTQLRAIDFSSDGRYVAYGGRNSTGDADPGTTYLAVYDLILGRRVFQENFACTGCANAELRQLAISSDGGKILAGDWGGRLHYYVRDAGTTNWTRTTQTGLSRVYWVDMNADGTRAAVGVQESGVRLFALGATATQLWERTGTDGGQRTVHITPDGRYISASSRGGGGGGGQIVVHDSSGTRVLSRASYAVNTASGWRVRGGGVEPEAWFARVSDDGSRALLASYGGVLYFFTRQ